LKEAYLLVLKALDSIRLSIEYDEELVEDFDFEARLTYLVEDLEMALEGEKASWWVFSRQGADGKEFDVVFDGGSHDNVLYGRGSWDIFSGPFFTPEEAEENIPEVME
jgi:hypothetical protein